MKKTLALEVLRNMADIGDNDASMFITQLEPKFRNGEVFNLKFQASNIPEWTLQCMQYFKQIGMFPWVKKTKTELRTVVVVSAKSNHGDRRLTFTLFEKGTILVSGKDLQIFKDKYFEAIKEQLHQFQHKIQDQIVNNYEDEGAHFQSPEQTREIKSSQVIPQDHGSTGESPASFESHVTNSPLNSKSYNTNIAHTLAHDSSSSDEITDISNLSLSVVNKAPVDRHKALRELKFITTGLATKHTDLESYIQKLRDEVIELKQDNKEMRATIIDLKKTLTNNLSKELSELKSILLISQQKNENELKIIFNNLAGQIAANAGKTSDVSTCKLPHASVLETNEVPAKDNVVSKNSRANRKQIASGDNANDLEKGHKSQLLIITDSHLRHINVNRIAKSANSKKVMCQGTPTHRFADEIESISKISNSYDQVILHVGSMDVHEKSQECSLNDIRHIVRKSRSAFPSARIFVSSILPKSDTKTIDIITNINNQIKLFCNEINIDFIDHTNTFTSKRNGLVSINKPLFLSDCIYLNQHGTKLLARNLIRAIHNITPQLSTAEKQAEQNTTTSTTKDAISPMQPSERTTRKCTDQNSMPTTNYSPQSHQEQLQQQQDTPHLIRSQAQPHNNDTAHLPIYSVPYQNVTHVPMSQNQIHPRPNNLGDPFQMHGPPPLQRFDFQIGPNTRPMQTTIPTNYPHMYHPQNFQSWYKSPPQWHYQRPQVCY